MQDLQGKIEKILWGAYKTGSSPNMEEIAKAILALVEEESAVRDLYLFDAGAKHAKAIGDGSVPCCDNGDMDEKHECLKPLDGVSGYGEITSKPTVSEQSNCCVVCYYERPDGTEFCSLPTCVCHKVTEPTVQGEWEENLQIEVMEDYVRHAEMLHIARDKKMAMAELRDDFDKLKDFIRQTLAEQREGIIKEAKEAIRKCASYGDGKPQGSNPQENLRRARLIDRGDAFDALDDIIRNLQK